MFRFKPLSDREINALQGNILLDDGIYSFVIKEAVEQQSKAGNPMLKIRLDILRENGRILSVFDYLVISEKMMFKLKHFCESIGIEDKYEQGAFSTNDCLNRSGKAKIGIQRGNLKEDGSSYADKNIVKDYIKSAEKVVKIQKTNEFVDDELPF